MKITVEIDDTLEERVESGVESLKERLDHYVEENPREENYGAARDQLLDEISEIANNETPCGYAEINDLHYLHGDALEQAYQDAGLGAIGDDNWKTTSIYCYLDQEIRNWLYGSGEEYFAELREQLAVQQSVAVAGLVQEMVGIPCEPEWARDLRDAEIGVIEENFDISQAVAWLVDPDHDVDEESLESLVSRAGWTVTRLEQHPADLWILSRCGKELGRDPELISLLAEWSDDLAETIESQLQARWTREIEQQGWLVDSSQPLFSILTPAGEVFDRPLKNLTRLLARARQHLVAKKKTATKSTQSA